MLKEITNFGLASTVAMQHRCRLSDDSETATFFNVNRTAADRWEFSVCLYEVVGSIQLGVSNFRVSASQSDAWAVKVEAMTKDAWGAGYAERLQDEIWQRAAAPTLSTLPEQLLAFILEEVDSLRAGDTLVLFRDDTTCSAKSEPSGRKLSAVVTGDSRMFWAAWVNGQGPGSFVDVSTDPTAWRESLNSAITRAESLSQQSIRNNM